MEAFEPPLIVLDTSVVVSALVSHEGTPHHRVLDRVAAGDVLLALSTESLRELSRVVGYPDVEPQIVSPARAFHYGLDLGTMGHQFLPRRYDWPSVPDPDDPWLLNLAWEARVDYIVTRDPHLTETTMPFPVEVVGPEQLLYFLPD